MRGMHRASAAVAAGLMAMGATGALTGCGKQEAAASAATAPTGADTGRLKQLEDENAKLKAEVSGLQAKVEELSLTPQVLLARVTQALAADKPDDARSAAGSLESRFGDSPQARSAKAALAKYDSDAAAREAQAKALEARGFYALQPQKAPATGGVTLRVESIQVGSRWEFDVHGDEWHYRDAERGQRFVLLRATVQSDDKRPDLPDVGVYRVDGKKMVRIGQVQYEFRRWSSYGTFIGLHHDFKNDFAHTSSIGFNAATRISEEEAKQPLAVVFTGQLCHERGSRIGQPEVHYSLKSGCSAKDELQVDDFAKGGYSVLTFFNRPKGV